MNHHHCPKGWVHQPWPHHGGSSQVSMEPNFLCKRCRTRRFKARLGASKLAWQIEQIERSANVDALRGDAWDRSQNGRLWFENMSKLSIKVGLSVFEWCLLYCKFLCMTGLNWAFIPVVSRPLGVQSFQVWGCLGVCGGVPLSVAIYSLTTTWQTPYF